jgi:hypothetical protein
MKKEKNPIKKVLKKAPDTKTMKRMMLPEVRVTAPRIRKVVEESVGLYPKGMASKRSVDSLKRVGFGKAIGEPMMRRGERAMYGTAASDIIKKALKRK